MSKTNHQCPRCQATENIRVFAYTKAGTPRYKCFNCFKTFTGTKVGRPTLGAEAMSNAARQKKFRDKKKFLS